MLIWGEAFWSTYTEGDNRALIATDSMKNFIQRETMNFEGGDLESYCRFIADQLPGQISAGGRRAGLGIGYTVCRPEGTSVAFAPAGPERAFAAFEISARRHG